MSNRHTTKFDRRQRGFTLAEILVTTAIFAIIMLAALAVYDRSNRVFKTSTEAADLQQSTRIGFDKLVSDLRMAGFDYNRGGVPEEGWQAPQPDEQIEYAGPTAVAFRANFNYNTAAAQDNGREQAYTPVNVDGQAIFPYVTTSNDEIVAYVLRSTNSAANTASISFYVDDYQPRSVFPSTLTPSPAGSNPSRPEEPVTITGIDTSNGNPPYTLYRVTVSDVRNGSLGTPVAENIRSLNFQYYTDAKGTQLLTNNDGTAITTGRNAGGGTFSAANTGAIGGAGQYDPANVGTTPDFNDRTQRSVVQSIRVDLVGMNASPDLEGYTHPTETISSIRSYRQYTLSSLVVPRNLGKTGFPEPTFNVPGQPTITGMCVGHCGAPIIYWEPPSVGGPVVQYRIDWDTNQNGAFTSGISLPDPSATSAVLPDDGSSDLSVPRYYRITAQNDNGPGFASEVFQATPQNRTRPQPPANLTASLGQPNQITLNWTAPSANASGQNLLSCAGTGGSTDGSAIPPQEAVRFKVWRGTSPNFDPTSMIAGVDNGVVVLDYTSPNQPSLASPGAAVSWIDQAVGTPPPPFPPANCKTYYYRVQAADRCVRQANYNVPASTTQAQSEFFPPLSANAISGSASSNVTPRSPVSLTVTRAASGCPDPQDLTSPNCRVVLDWDKVTTDTSGAQTAVDTYRITRSFRLQAVGGPFAPDVTFGPSGQQDINCAAGLCDTTPPGSYTQLASGRAGYTDFPPVVDGTGQALEYQYTVAALGCMGAQSVPTAQPNDPYSVESNPVIYPGCSTNPTIVQQNAQNPLASGDTPGEAWIFDSGDTITVNPADPPTIASVRFDVSTWPQGVAVPALSFTTLFPGPYILTWSNQIDQQIYTVRITVTTNSVPPCQEIHVKYVQDQQGAPCAFANVTPPAPSLAVPPGNQPDRLITMSSTFTVSNSGTEPMQLAARNIAITWGLPATDTRHSDIKMTQLLWATGAFSQTDNIVPPAGNVALPAGTQTTVTRVVPAAMPNVDPGVSFTVTVRWQYLKRDDCDDFDCPTYIAGFSLTTNPITKMCIDYQVASEPGVTKHCNRVGQSASTANPTSCD